ncbi:MAG: hypothetical protein AMJ70_08555, partial [Dehalococcoidia bacterium SG8_51_3]
MTGSYFLFWHDDTPGEIQLINSITYNLAVSMVQFPNDSGLRHAKQNTYPTPLERVCMVERDMSLVDKAVEHWPKTDSTAKPALRAAE